MSVNQLRKLIYPQPIEEAIATLSELLMPLETAESPRFTKRSIALLLLQNDQEILQQLPLKPIDKQAISQAIEVAQAQFQEPLAEAIATARQQHAWQLQNQITTSPQRSKRSLAHTLHQLTVYPLTGIPLLVIILYYGVYKFVGEFGAGTLVDTIEVFFETYINPSVNYLAATLIPWQPLQDLVANDYGIITLGIRYAVAIILPIVTTFFLMFSLLEDSGYLPRLSLLIDRLFKSIGLSGRAVIPIVLGLGCGTMATLVTRTLETKRERLIATVLLASTIPCSAQLGVVLGLLTQTPTGLFAWLGIMTCIFLIIGFLFHRSLPGEHPCFYMEIPPLRLPTFKAVITKTFIRLKWYFAEILPLFVLASVLIWVGKLTGIFDKLVQGLEPVMHGLGLPPAAASVFLFGFFRRDYGAAGLFDLQQQGVLTPHQLVVAAVTLTLFIPCIAQLQIMIKERGVKVASAIAIFVFASAFLIGYCIHTFMTLVEVFNG